MQKKLIAVAIAGLVSGAAFAQSNVTISGVADAYYGRLSGDGYKSYNAVNSGGLSGSRIAFNGSEDLGNGLKAIFQMEQKFNITDGATDLTTTRQSYVGLAGSFGAVVAGRLQAPGYYVGKFDALASAAISPQAILANGKMIGGGVQSTIAPDDDARLNSSVAYLSPSFGGFTAVVAASAASNNTTTEQATLTDSANDTGVYGLGLNYAIGPVAVGFVHHNIQNHGAASQYDAKENMLGASYDAGFLKVLASYQDAKLSDHIAGDGLTTDRNKLYQIGVVVPVGAGNIHAAYGKLDMKDDTMDAKSMTIAYTHALSKRTTAYTGYNKTDNKENQTLGLTTVDTTTTGDTTAKGFVVGLRHTF